MARGRGGNNNNNNNNNSNNNNNNNNQNNNYRNGNNNSNNWNNNNKNNNQNNQNNQNGEYGRVKKRVTFNDPVTKAIEMAYAEGINPEYYGTMLMQIYRKKLEIEQERLNNEQPGENINLMSVDAAQAYAEQHLHSRRLALHGRESYPRLSRETQAAIIRATGQGSQGKKDKSTAEILRQFRSSQYLNDAETDVQEFFRDTGNDELASLRIENFLATTSWNTRSMILTTVANEHKNGQAAPNLYDQAAPANNQQAGLAQGFQPPPATPATFQPVLVPAASVQPATANNNGTANDYTYATYLNSQAQTNQTQSNQTQQNGSTMQFGAAQNTYGVPVGAARQHFYWGQHQQWQQHEQNQQQAWNQPQGWNQFFTQPRPGQAPPPFAVGADGDVMMTDADAEPQPATSTRARRYAEFTQQVGQMLEEHRQAIDQRLDQAVNHVQRSQPAQNDRVAITHGRAVYSEHAWVPVARFPGGFFLMERVDGERFMRERIVNTMGRLTLNSEFNDMSALGTAPAPARGPATSNSTNAAAGQEEQDDVDRPAPTRMAPLLQFTSRPAHQEFALHVLYTWLPTLYHLLTMDERIKMHDALVGILHSAAPRLNRATCDDFSAVGSAGCVDIARHLRALLPEQQWNLLHEIRRQVLGDGRQSHLNRAAYLNPAGVERAERPESLRSLRRRLALPTPTIDANTLVQNVRSGRAENAQEISEDTAGYLAELIDYHAKLRTLRMHARRDPAERAQMEQQDRAWWGVGGGSTQTGAAGTTRTQFERRERPAARSEAARTQTRQTVQNHGQDRTQNRTSNQTSTNTPARRPRPDARTDAAQDAASQQSAADADRHILENVYRTPRQLPPDAQRSMDLIIEYMSGDFQDATRTDPAYDAMIDFRRRMRDAVATMPERVRDGPDDLGLLTPPASRSRSSPGAPGACPRCRGPLAATCPRCGPVGGAAGGAAGSTIVEVGEEEAATSESELEWESAEAELVTREVRNSRDRNGRSLAGVSSQIDSMLARDASSERRPRSPPLRRPPGTTDGWLGGWWGGWWNDEEEI